MGSNKFKHGVKILLISILLVGCYSIKELNTSWARNRNVCKSLTGKVLVYTVFVDGKETMPWDENSKEAYKDSLNIALNWLSKQAKENNVPLELVLKFHKDVCKKGAPAGVYESGMDQLGTFSGFESFNKHYDGIAKQIGGGVEKQKDAIGPYVKKVKSKERLVAQLRNQYQVESVVLMFVHPSKGLKRISFAINTLNNSDVEYLVNSFYEPTVIAFRIMELFGASSLTYPNDPKLNSKIYTHVKDNFPNDIMANPMKENIRALNIGEFTQYLIGWKSSFDEKHNILLKGPKIKIK